MSYCPPELRLTREQRSAVDYIKWQRRLALRYAAENGPRHTEYQIEVLDYLSVLLESDIARSRAKEKQP